MAGPGVRSVREVPAPHGYQEGPPPPNHPWDSPQFPAGSGVGGAGGGGGGGTQTPLATRAPVNISLGRRTALGVGASVGLAAVGVGLGVGLEEGIPRVFGAQGIGGAAVNPDEKKDPNDPLAMLTSLPVLLIIGAVIVVVMMK